MTSIPKWVPDLIGFVSSLFLITRVLWSQYYAKKAWRLDHLRFTEDDDRFFKRAQSRLVRSFKKKESEWSMASEILLLAGIVMLILSFVSKLFLM